MGDITTASVYEHEIAKNDDFQYGFESLIRNTAVLDRMLVSAETDYVVGGIVLPVTGSAGIRVGKIWGNGLDIELPVFCNHVSDLIPVTLPFDNVRIDTVQVRSVFEEFDEQRRAFFNPETESGQSFMTPTKRRLKIEYLVKPGTEGQQLAPEADAGWIKAGEIFLEPGLSVIPQANIRNITAIHQGEENEAWTNQKGRTFQLGSFLELKSILALEHTIQGAHRPHVIKAPNIDFGENALQVNGKRIPLGEDYQIGTDRFEALESLFDCLIKEAGYRRAGHAASAAAISTLNTAINQIMSALTGLVPEAPDDGPVYGRKNKMWVEAADTGGGETGPSVEIFKLFSKKTLMMTNRRIVDRRQAGWDIGLPYLSAASRVYHFDTDLLDQYQQSNIAIDYDGEAPALKGREDTNGRIYFNPAVLDHAPYEMPGRSLHGYFAITAQLPAIDIFTAEAWIRFFYEKNAVILRLASAIEEIVIRLGWEDPEYSEPGDDEAAYDMAAQGGIPYSIPGVISAKVPYSEPGDDEAAYDEAGVGDIPYSIESTNWGNTATHTWQGGSEEVSLDDIGFVISDDTWLHIAAVSTANVIALFIGDAKVEFTRESKTAQPVTFTLNEGKNEFNADELSINQGVAVDFDDFAANTHNRIPYAGLNHNEKWMVLEAQDPEKVKTNLFGTEQFRAAVQAVIDNQ